MQEQELYKYKHAYTFGKGLILAVWCVLFFYHQQQLGSMEFCWPRHCDKLIIDYILVQ